MSQLKPNDPVTTIITRFVQKDKVEAFEKWVKEMTAVRSKFEGYRGMDIIRPSDHNRPEYILVLKFDSYENFQKWCESQDRIDMVTRSIKFTIGESDIGDIKFEQQSGLEYWFDHPKHILERPARYKMSILTGLVIYPLIFLSNLLLTPILSFLPFPLILFMIVALNVSLMTYILMPKVTQMFDFWLFQ